MRIYDTLSGKKEELPAVSLSNLPRPKRNPLRPVQKSQGLRLFVCGPTVYGDSHIGHARTYLVFDALVKYLRSESIKVSYLQNITDIDDKIIARAKEEGITPAEIAEKYLKGYYRNIKSLGITSIDTYARATDYIPEIVSQVKRLMGGGYAYKISGDGVYFDITKFSDYGRLARRTVAQAEDAESRIDESVKKRNKGDFALWKFSKKGEPSWPSELGDGRPGWHIEDTAMSEKHFGLQYELHGGAIDLKFPHHEAEIAQAESLSEKKLFVKIWMHTGFLTVHGKKMSKSLKNFVTIQEFLKKYPAEVLRLLVLSHHYRSPINYTESLAEDYRKSWNSILEFLGKVEFVERQKPRHRSYSQILKNIGIKKADELFSKALEDDFNTPKAVAAIFELINVAQPKVWQFSSSDAKATKDFVARSLKSLGFSISLLKIPSKINALAKEREKYRDNKQFVQSDALRKEIDGLGYVIEDTPVGPFLWPK